MSKLPVISGKDLIKILLIRGFEITLINGSHHRLKHPHGTLATIPVHKNEPFPKGLLYKIITKDLEISIEDFSNWLIS